MQMHYTLVTTAARTMMQDLRSLLSPNCYKLESMTYTRRLSATALSLFSEATALTHPLCHSRYPRFARSTLRVPEYETLVQNLSEIEPVASQE